MALELEGSSWDSLSAFVFSLQGICVNYIYENPSHNCLTNSLYFLNKGSFILYSPKTCRTTNWESMNTISFLTLIFLASHRLASKASCAEYLNSSLFRPISRIPALAPSCADDPSTYTNQTFDSWPNIFWQTLFFVTNCCPWFWFWNLWKEHSVTKSVRACFL